jgi:hypothetical protein
VFDKWIEKHYPDIVFEWYADDIVVHCRHIKQALRHKTTVKRLQTGIKQGEVQNRLLPPKPKEAATIQSVLSEIRFPGFFLQATHYQDVWQTEIGIYPCN